MAIKTNRKKPVFGTFRKWKVQEEKVDWRRDFQKSGLQEVRLPCLAEVITPSEFPYPRTQRTW